jgi:hypothetical protein
MSKTPETERIQLPKDKLNKPDRLPSKEVAVEGHIFKLHPEKKSHVKGIRKLDKLTPDLLNENTGAYDSGKMSKHEIKDWMRDSKLFWGFNGTQKDKKHVEGNIYLQPDEKKRIKFIKKIDKEPSLKFPEQPVVYDMSYARLPNVSDLVAAEALTQAMDNIFNGKNGENAVVMYYMAEDHKDNPPIRMIGAQIIGHINYDHPKRSEDLDAMFCITKTTFEAAKADFGRTQLNSLVK